MINRNYLLLPHPFFSLSLSFLYGLTLRRIFHSHTTQFEKFSFPFSYLTPPLYLCFSKSRKFFVSLYKNSQISLPKRFSDFNGVFVLRNSIHKLLVVFQVFFSRFNSAQFLRSYTFQIPKKPSDSQSTL